MKYRLDTPFFGGSMIFMANLISDTRNQAGVEQTAIMEGDSRSLMTLIVLVTLMLCYFDFVARVNGSLGEFLTQTWWKTDVRTVSVVTVGEDLHMGVNSLLQTTLQVALGALVIAIPIGLGTAIYLSEYASQRTANFVKPILELLAGIPSVVYGFFAFVVIAPIVVDVGTYFLERGWIAEEPQLFNPLSGAIVVGIMITPLIASLLRMLCGQSLTTFAKHPMHLEPLLSRPQHVSQFHPHSRGFLLQSSLLFLERLVKQWP